MNNLAEAVVHYTHAATLCAEAGDSLCLAESWEQLSVLNAELGHFEEALRYLNLAKPLIKKFGGEHQYSTMLSNQGGMLVDQGFPAKAIPHYEESIRLGQKLGRHKNESQGMNNLAEAYLLLGEYERALGLFDTCLQRNQQHGFLESTIVNYYGLH